MEAIAELLAALFMAMFSGAMGVVELLIELIFCVVEFVLTLAFSGKDAANARYQERRDAARKKRESAAARTEPQHESSANPNQSAKQPLQHALEDNVAWEDRPTPTRSARSHLKRNVAIAAIGGFVVLASVVGAEIRRRMDERKIDATKAQIATMGEQLREQIAGGQRLNEGMLTEQDAWDRYLELFVDESLLGSMLVVRSAGPDGQRGTLDDLLAVRFARAPMKDMAVALLKRGANLAKDQLGNEGLAEALKDKLFQKLRSTSLPEYVDYGDDSAGRLAP